MQQNAYGSFSFKDRFTKFKEEWAFIDSSFSNYGYKLNHGIIMYFAQHRSAKVSNIDAFLVQFPKINKGFLPESIYSPSSLTQTLQKKYKK